MSYILDALNKSEQDRREQDNVPSLQAIHEEGVHGHSDAAWKRWLPVAVAGLILTLFAVILLMWFSGSSRSSSTEGTSSAGSPLLKPLGNSQMALSNQAGPSSQALRRSQVSSSDFMTASAPKPTVASLYSQASRTHETDANGASGSAATVDSHFSTSAKTSREATSSEVERSYEAYRQIEQSILGDSTTPVQSALGTEMAESLEPAVPAQKKAVGGPEALPQVLLSRIPKLNYSAHVYSNDESSGFAIINGRSRYKGDLLSDSLFVEAVEEDGVLLNIQGISFKLKAMKSWPPR